MPPVLTVRLSMMWLIAFAVGVLWTKTFNLMTSLSSAQDLDLNQFRLKIGPQLTVTLDVGKKEFAHSQYGQDLWVDAVLFDRKEKGFFIEAGALDGVSDSNTYFFEKVRNWKGLLVEPTRNFRDKIRRNRKRSVLYQGCLSEKPGSMKFSVDGFGGLGKVKSSSNQGIFASYFGGGGSSDDNGGGDDPYRGHRRDYTVECDSVTNLLQEVIHQHNFGRQPATVAATGTRHPQPEDNNNKSSSDKESGPTTSSGRILHVDYFSLDVEGHEMKVLDGIDFNRVFIDVFQLEVPPPNELQSEKIPGRIREFRSYLEPRGYFVTGSLPYGCLWGFNCVDIVFVRRGSEPARRVHELQLGENLSLLRD